MFVSIIDSTLLEELVIDGTLDDNDVDYIVDTWQRACIAPHHAKVGIWAVVDQEDGEEVYCHGYATSLKNLAKLVEHTVNCTPADDWFLDISY